MNSSNQDNYTQRPCPASSFSKPSNAVSAPPNAARHWALAATWPTTTAEINRWTILPADEAEASFSNAYQIEAGFHFTLDGDYFGGYVRSTPTSHSAAERAAHGNPTLTIRYNPANPDQTAVLAEDNAGNLSFEVLSA